MKKNVNKLIAASLVTTMGLGYINYPVYAQEETDNTDTIFSEEKWNDEAVEAEETSENEKTEVEEETSISEMDKIEETNDTNSFLSLPKPLAEIAEKDSVVNEIQPLANETITYDNLTITGETSNYTYSGGTLTITGNGAFSLSGDFSKLIINPELTVTLNLNNVDLYVLYDNTVTIGANSELTLNLIGSNTFVCHTAAGTSSYLLTISGDTNSNLIINSDSGSAGSLSIQKWGGVTQNCRNVSITINGGTVSGINGVTPIYGTNSWVSDLIISDITYGEMPSPSAVAKIGTPTYTYATEENGTYTSAAPITAGTYYVKATVSYGGESLEAIKKFEIEKADSEIAFVNGFSLDKQYDGNTVTIGSDDLTKTGSTNTVTFTWYKKDGNDWTKLEESPVNAGNYKVVASVEADANYKGATAEKEFSISQTTNEWTSELSIADWTYGQTASTPVATAKYGNVVFTYSDKKDGTYTGKVPTEAGTWYVKATVEGNENYTGMVATDSFEISKAQPSFTLPKDLVIKQGDALSTVSLPDGFTWADDTQTADVLGTQPFKAVFTPEDTTNYQTVEVDITVEVVPAVSVINKAPKITAEDKTLTVGDTFDAMKDVTATDAEDGDLTDKIVITKNTVDTSKAGKYTVVYEVTDSHGIRVVRTIYVTVQQKTTDTDKEDSNKNSTKDTAQTSTQTNVMAWSVLGIASLGALLAVLFKRKHQ
ncbi:immunoglobulin-like domain-containing protein [Faecalitalea cylindroides]|uniref:Bacterial group 3 Ig-like protein n=1 Tax=Faecalitalea cylindroides ATCC 27803 TaxID=649755 RepID=U2P722_9FIRM|nr:immunoglobulin-like domain-containing protein [Faecalitalea cylindroides]ERK46315.1 bacterial group 3 Ig-like protein [[Eubacterium] cylindroides ATCC 27803] [Faecalitalea cylindroides ATCC 27803]